MGVVLGGVVITSEHTIDIEPMNVSELSLQQNKPGVNIAKHSKIVKVKLQVTVYELALNRKGFSHAKCSSTMVIQYFLPLHLNPGGVDYEDFIQQSMSLDFTFDNSRKKVMKMFFQ